MTRPDKMLEAMDELKREYKRELIPVIINAGNKIVLNIDNLIDGEKIENIYIGYDFNTDEKDAVLLSITNEYGEKYTRNIIEDCNVMDVYAIYDYIYRLGY